MATCRDRTCAKRSSSSSSSPRVATVACVRCRKSFCLECVTVTVVSKGFLGIGQKKRPVCRRCLGLRDPAKIDRRRNDTIEKRKKEKMEEKKEKKKNKKKEQRSPRGCGREGQVDLSFLSIAKSVAKEKETATDWACSVCTFVNDCCYQLCEICGSPRTIVVPDIEYDRITIESLSKGCSVIPLAHGTVLFKNALDEEAQIKVLRTCMQMASQGSNATLLPRKLYTSTSKAAKPLLFYNWPGYPKSAAGIKRPTELLDFATTLFSLANVQTTCTLADAQREEDIGKDRDFVCPDRYEPDALYAILYPHGGSFMPHVDGAKGWVLAISIGDSAEFFISKGELGERTSVCIDSGDVVIFNGGQLHHGVSKIFPDTAPAFWHDPSISEVPVFGMSRLNLQFRDPGRDRLYYYPHFASYKDPALKASNVG